MTATQKEIERVTGCMIELSARLGLTPPSQRRDDYMRAYVQLQNQLNALKQVEIMSA